MPKQQLNYQHFVRAALGLLHTHTQISVYVWAIFTCFIKIYFFALQKVGSRNFCKIRLAAIVNICTTAVSEVSYMYGYTQR